VKYRLVIFDFDGTLADTFPWFVSVFDAVADKYGFRRIDKSEIEVYRGLDARQIVKRLGVPFWKLPFVAAHMRTLIARDIEQVALFPGIPELLERLHSEGVLLAVVSSNSEANVRHVLGARISSLIQRFECGSSMYGKASRFKRVLRLTRVPAQSALSVGDELRALAAARVVGIPFGAVTWGFTTPNALEAGSPDHLFGSVDDIAAAVL